MDHAITVRDILFVGGTTLGGVVVLGVLLWIINAYANSWRH